MILANGLFVAAEFALVAVDRSRMDHLAEDGSRRARMVVELLRHLSFHLSGAQLGITVTSLVVGFLAQPTIARLIEPALEPLLGEAGVAGVALLVALVVATVFQMLIGELVPKGLAIARPETTALLLAPIIRVYGIVAGPVIRFLNGSANRTVRLLGVEPTDELSHVQTLSELQVLVEASAEEGTLADSASRLLTRSIRFEAKTAEDVLVPRPAVQSLTVEASVADLVALSSETGYSRFLVDGGDLDDVRGVVHVRRVHTIARERWSDTPVTELMVPILAIPESRSLDDVLVDLRRGQTHLAVVVDEYGGTAGIITLEDVLEEIVGEIDDEHDPVPARLTRPGRSGEWVVDGSAHRDELSDLTGLELPDGEYETLAGYLLIRLGHIPVEGERVDIDGWSASVVAMDRHRIAEVRLRAPDTDDAARTATDPADVVGRRGGGRP